MQCCRHGMQSNFDWRYTLGWAARNSVSVTHTRLQRYHTQIPYIQTSKHISAQSTRRNSTVVRHYSRQNASVRTTVQLSSVTDTVAGHRMSYHEYVPGAYYGLKDRAPQKRYLVTGILGLRLL